MKIQPLLLCTLVGLGAAGLVAAPYSIDWFAVAAGGASTNASYALSGAAGQVDASATPLAAGPYSLTGGFYSLVAAVPTQGAPLLTIAASEAGTVISWPAGSAGWTLQTNATLTGGAWGAYRGVVVGNRTTNAVTRDALFLRLHQ